MTNNPVNIVKNLWRINQLGAGMFTIGTVLCMISVILSIVWRLDFVSVSDNATYVVAMIGIGVPFMLSGIGILLRPQKLPTSMIPEETIENYTTGTIGNYVQGTDGNYIGETNENYAEWTDENFVGRSDILIIELVTSLVLAILLSESYPNGWNYPNFYILILLYAMCLLLLTIGILSNISEKETDISYMRKEIECSNMIIEEKEEMCKDNSAPDYTNDFAKKLNGNIDDLKAIMDELKISIDIGTKGIAERTAMVANKYRSDNEKLHNDLQGFKQRTEKEKIEFKERANERVIKSLMNTLLSIDELSKYRDKNASYTVSDIGGIKENIYNIIKCEDVVIINPSIGDNFDDKKCCAIKTIETDKFPDNRIMDIKKIGCMFKSGKVINYADVIVSKSSIRISDNNLKVKAAKVDAKIDAKVDAKVDAKIAAKVDAKIAAKVDAKIAAKVDAKIAAKVDAKVDAKAQIETAKVDTKVDTKAQIETAKVDIKEDVKTDTKTGIQALIEYIKTIIYGKADNNEQNKKDGNKKDENNKVCITPEFKKKGD